MLPRFEDRRNCYRVAVDADEDRRNFYRVAVNADEDRRKKDDDIVVLRKNHYLRSGDGASSDMVVITRTASNGDKDQEALPASSKNSTFKTGDRVKYVGNRRLLGHSSREPSFGYWGNVALTFKENLCAKIGSADLPQLDSFGGDDAEKLAINELFEAALCESKNSPLILFLKDIEKSVLGISEAHAVIKNRLESLPANVVIIGSHIQTDNRREKSHPGGLLFTKFGSNQTALLDFAFPEASAASPKNYKFKTGDRVKYVGNLRPPGHSSRGPFGYRGKVALTFEENYAKIGVRFDQPIQEGNDLGGRCDKEHGFFCSADLLQLDSSGGDDAEKLAINELFEVALCESKNSPLILFLKDIEKSVLGISEAHAVIKNRLESLPASVVIIGSHTQMDNRKEKLRPGGLLCTKFGSNQTALPDFVFPGNIGRLHDRSKEISKTSKPLTRFFQNGVTIQLQQDEALLLDWKQQLDRDIETFIVKSNAVSIRSDVVIGNEFEKRLLADIIPPNDIGVPFDDIGALENVKDTSKELVMLPLQRPESFSKGQLTKACKGILPFGPPGTGKTMLAEAVATKPGANFIKRSMSSITSKWFGIGEKYVNVVFSLASKIAPRVVNENLCVTAAHRPIGEIIDKEKKCSIMVRRHLDGLGIVLNNEHTDNFGRIHERSKDISKTTKQLARLFPNRVTIQLPQDEALLLDWKQQLDRDIETLKVKSNAVSIRSDLVTENEFEKRLLADVIPPNIGVTFDDTGALENVKDKLKELVMLPLQRPKLFSKGQLTKMPSLGDRIFTMRHARGRRIGCREIYYLPRVAGGSGSPPPGGDPPDPVGPGGGDGWDRPDGLDWMFFLLCLIMTAAGVLEYYFPGLWGHMSRSVLGWLQTMIAKKVTHETETALGKGAAWVSCWLVKSITRGDRSMDG